MPLDTVILIDDSVIDNKLHRRVIERSGLTNEVLTFSLAEEAMEYLRAPGAVPADLILLDVNMPRVDGFEMLDAATEELGQSFTSSSVVMLTTSMDPSDRNRSDEYEMVKGYVIKPLTTERFTELFHSLDAVEGEPTAA